MRGLLGSSKLRLSVKRRLNEAHLQWELESIDRDFNKNGLLSRTTDTDDPIAEYEAQWTAKQSLGPIRDWQKNKKLDYESFGRTLSNVRETRRRERQESDQSKDGQRNDAPALYSKQRVEIKSAVSNLLFDPSRALGIKVFSDIKRTPTAPYQSGKDDQNYPDTDYAQACFKDERDFSSGYCSPHHITDTTDVGYKRGPLWRAELPGATNESGHDCNDQQDNNHGMLPAMTPCASRSITRTLTLPGARTEEWMRLQEARLRKVLEQRKTQWLKQQHLPDPKKAGKGMIDVAYE